MATSNQDIVTDDRIVINGQLVQFVDKKVSEWLGQKEPSFSAAVFIAMVAVEDFAKEAKLNANQKHNLATDLIENVLNCFARYKSDFAASLPTMKEKLANPKVVDEFIELAIVLSADPNAVNPRWNEKKKKRRAGCFGK